MASGLGLSLSLPERDPDGTCQHHHAQQLVESQSLNTDMVGRVSAGARAFTILRCSKMRHFFKSGILFFFFNEIHFNNTKMLA